NLSCISERSIRSRRLRSTAFSIPEYACTTYQRLLLAGASDAAVSADVLSSSVMAFVLKRVSTLPAQDQVVQQPFKRLVGQKQKQRHHENEGEDVAGHLQRF